MSGYSWSMAMILVYFAATIYIGIWAWRSFPQTNVEEYMLSGRSVGFVAAALCTMATQYSALTVLGFPATMYRGGIGGYVAILGMYAGFTALSILMLGGKAWKTGRRFGHKTMADTLTHYFGSPALGYLASAVALISIIPYLQTQIMGVAKLMEVATGGLMTYAVGAVFTYIVIGFYSYMGGMRAVIYTDIMQGVLILIGTAVTALILVYMVGGGWGPLYDAAIKARPTMMLANQKGSPWTWSYLVSWAIPVGLGWMMHPHMWLRWHLTKTVSFWRTYPVIATGSFIIVMGAAWIVSLAAAGFMGQLTPAQTDSMVVLAVDKFMPKWYLGFVAATALAAMMSTLSGQVHGFATTFIHDFITRGKSAGPQVVTMMRATIFIVSAIGLGLSFLNPPFLVTLGAFSAAMGSLLLPVIAAPLLDLKWITRQGAFWGLLAGNIAMFWTGFPNPGQTWRGIYAGSWGLIAVVVVMVVVSLLTPNGRPKAEITKEYEAIGY